MVIPDNGTEVAVDFTATDLKLDHPSQMRQMLQELERRKEQARDTVAPASKLRMTDDNQLAVTIPGSEWPVAYPLRKVAHAQIAAKMRIPSRYYQRMQANAPELLAQNVNRWLHDTKEGRSFLVRVLPDTQGTDFVRAILSNRFLLLSSYDVIMRGAKAAQQHDAEIISFYHDEEITHMKIMLRQFGFRVTGRRTATAEWISADHRDPDSGLWIAPEGEGRLCFPALSISNSEVGLGALTVKLALQVNDCENSIVMVFGETYRRIHLGPRLGEGSVFKTGTQEAKDREIWLEAGELIDAAFNPDTFAATIADCNRTQDEKLDDPVKAVNAVVESFGLGDDEKQAIINELFTPSRGDPVGATVWGLINAITARAQAKTSVAETVKFEEAGGALIDADQKLVKVLA